VLGDESEGHLDVVDLELNDTFDRSRRTRTKP
jgi:hypothetical protein